MKLDKITRRRLYTNAGPVGFIWPAGSEPKRGNVYAIETDKGAGEGRFRVLTAKRMDDDRFYVECQLQGDTIRLLDKRGGYTSYDGQALRSGAETEPEAVDRATQDRFAKQAHAGRSITAGELIDHLNEVTAILAGKVAAHPDVKLVSRELWAARGRIDAAKRKLTTRAAA